MSLLQQESTSPKNTLRRGMINYSTNEMMLVLSRKHCPPLDADVCTFSTTCRSCVFVGSQTSLITFSFLPFYPFISDTGQSPGSSVLWAFYLISLTWIPFCQATAYWTSVLNLSVLVDLNLNKKSLLLLSPIPLLQEAAMAYSWLAPLLSFQTLIKFSSNFLLIPFKILFKTPLKAKLQFNWLYMVPNCGGILI